MCKIDFKPILLTDKVDVFSIRVDDSPESEFEKFYIQFKNTDDSFLINDLERILATIDTIGQIGVLGNQFRPEGKLYDRVFALPLLTIARDKTQHGTLRLYCIRASDRLLILGGGGLKTTQNYEDDPVLSANVELLQKIDQELLLLEDNGIEINDAIYNLTIDIE